MAERKRVAYCDRCNNMGTVECECGGDLCVCGAGEIDCPACLGGELIMDEQEIWERENGLHD